MATLGGDGVATLGGVGTLAAAAAAAAAAIAAVLAALDLFFFDFPFGI